MKKTVLGLALIIGTTGITGCAEMKRSSKNIESSIGGGLQRKVEVFSNTGEIIRNYEGKIDVQYREDGTTMFELNNKRVMIKNAITIVEEQ